MSNETQIKRFLDGLKAYLMDLSHMMVLMHVMGDWVTEKNLPPCKGDRLVMLNTLVEFGLAERKEESGVAYFRVRDADTKQEDEVVYYKKIKDWKQ